MRFYKLKLIFGMLIVTSLVACGGTTSDSEEEQMAEETVIEPTPTTEEDKTKSLDEFAASVEKFDELIANMKATADAEKKIKEKINSATALIKKLEAAPESQASQAEEGKDTAKDVEVEEEETKKEEGQ